MQTGSQMQTCGDLVVEFYYADATTNNALDTALFEDW